MKKLIFFLLLASSVLAQPGTGVTQIRAGNGVTIAPASGRGQVTINATATGDVTAAGSNAFTGINSFAGSNVSPANALGAFVIDVTKWLNTKTIATEQTFTFSGAPATAQTWFALLVTNSDASVHTLTIPSSFSVSRSGAITTVIIPASGKMMLNWQYDGSVYNLYGDPVATTGGGTSYLQITADNTVGRVARVTGTGTVAFGAVDLADTDAVTGVLPITNQAVQVAGMVSTYATPDTTGGAVTLTQAVTEVWTNTTTTYTIPAVASSTGKAIIFYVVGTNALTIDPNASEIVVKAGTPLAGGTALTLTGAAGNYVCLVCDGTRWVTLGYTGTLGP